MVTPGLSENQRVGAILDTHQHNRNFHSEDLFLSHAPVPLDPMAADHEAKGWARPPQTHEYDPKFARARVPADVSRRLARVADHRHRPQPLHKLLLWI